MKEKILLVLFVITFPLVAYISTRPTERFRNEITEWGDRNSVAYAQFDQYREKFGPNEVVLLSWPGCDLADDRISRVTTKIETELEGLVRNVSSGQQAYQSLRDEAKLSQSAALKRLRNVFIGKTDEKTAVGFQLTDQARLDRGEVVSRLDEILESSGVDPALVTYAGLAHNLYTLDKEGLESPFRMVPQIMLLALLLTFVFVRNVRLALFINALGTYTGCLAFNIVWLADTDMNAIIWPLPTLTMLLTVSASLHFLSYFQKAAESHDLSFDTDSNAEPTRPERIAHRRAVARSAVRLAIKPVLCCTFTTAIGLLSLLLSTSEPVRQFGLFGAISVSAANLLMLLWFPPLLTLIGHAENAARSNRESHALIETPTQSDRWNSWGKLIRKRRWAIVTVCLIAIVVGAIGLPKVKTGSNLENFFPADHQVLASARKMESRIGPLNSVELLLQFDNADSSNDLLRLKGLRALAGQIQSKTEFESCVSAGTFAPVFKSQRGALKQAAERTRIEKFKQEFIKAGLVHSDSENCEETWRISCRYSVFADIDLDEQTKRLNKIVDELFNDDGKLIFAGESLTTTTTGEFVLFDFVDSQFFKELMLTYVTAFSVITLVVLIVLRNLKAALIALLPNLFPALAVLGAAGFLGYSLDVASLMTASVALGIAVDDTLHFLMWHQETKSSSQMSDRSEDPIDTAMRYCGKAMIQTSMVLGLSMVLYAFCGFLPTVRFGILLSTMMFAALIGDLLLLPALMSIVGRTRRFRHGQSDSIIG